MQLVENFGAINSYAEYDAFLQALRGLAAQKAQGNKETPPVPPDAVDPVEFQKQAIRVAEELNIPEQVVKQIIRDQFGVIDTEDKRDALIQALRDLAAEYAVKAGKTKETPATEKAPPATENKPVLKAPPAAKTDPAVKAPPAAKPEKGGPAGAGSASVATIETSERVRQWFFAEFTKLSNEAKKKGVTVSGVQVVFDVAGVQNPKELEGVLVSREQAKNLLEQVRVKVGLACILYYSFPSL